MKKLLKKKMIMVFMAAVLILSLSGCSTDKNETKTDANSSSSETNADTSVSENSSEEVGEVETIKIGIGNILAPQFYVNEDGELVGYDVDVLKAVDELLPQYEFSFEQMEFASLLVSLEAGKIDIADFQLTKNAEREETYLFPEENYDVAQVALIVSDDKENISGLEDMAGMSIAQMPTSSFYTIVDTYNQKNPDSTIDLQAIDSLPVADALQIVADGRIDGTICLASTFNDLQKTMGLKVHVAGVLSSYPVYWILQKDSEQLKSDIDSAVVELKESGKLSEISNQWYGMDVFGE